MKDECDVVQDLLPSYIDEICSTGSEVFVKEHVAQCKACHTVLNNMIQELAIESEEEISERIEAKKPFEKVSRFFQVQKRMTRFIFLSALVCFIVGGFLLFHSLVEIRSYQDELKSLSKVEDEKEEIMDEAFTVLNSTSNPSKYKTQLIDLFNEHNKKIKYLAVFPAAELKGWISKYPSIKKEPKNIYPLDYSNASLIIGSEGAISDKEKIVTSKYDLGNVVYADHDWVVQFEYKASYEPVIERYHQLSYYGPSIMTIFWPPLFALTLCIIFFILWLFLNTQNKRLNL